MTNNKFEARLVCFWGLYESLEQEALERRLGIAEGYEDEETGEFRELEDGEYKEASIELAKDYVEYFKEVGKEFLNKYNCTIEFVKMTSPQFYNYTTDRIYVNVEWDFTDDDDFELKLTDWVEEYDKKNSESFDIEMYYYLSNNY